MNPEPGIPPGLVLAFLLGLSIIVFTPLVGWLLLTDQRTRPVRMWYGGLAFFALASLVFTLVPLLGEPVVALVPGALTLACLIMLTESIRIERNGERMRWSLLTIPVVFFAVQWILLKAGLREFEGVLLQQALILALVLRLLLALFALRRREPSRGLFFIQGGTLLLAGGNVLRILYIFLEGRDPGLMGLRSISNLLFILTVMAPVFWSLGYWGHVLERTTRQVAAEQERTRLASEAQAQAEQWARQLQAALSERDHMVVLNSQFASVQTLALFNAGIVHELSHPLQSLSMVMSELACELDRSQGLPPQIKQLQRDAMRLNVEAVAMLRSLRSLMGSSNTDTELVDLRPLLSEVLAVMRSELKHHQIGLALDDQTRDNVPLLMYANPVLLQRVLLNVLGNALQELREITGSERRGFIEVTLSRESGSDPHVSWIKLEIVDDGRGLSAEQLAQIGQLLPSGKTSGLGVGLALVKMLIDNWGGQLLVESPPEGKVRGTSVQLFFKPGLMKSSSFQRL